MTEPSQRFVWTLSRALGLCSGVRWMAEKAVAPHSSTLAWKTPWMEEPGRLQSMGSLRVGHYWATSLSLFTFVHWRRKWQPTPVFLPGESHGWRSLVGCSPWDRWGSDTTEQLHFHFSLSCVGEENGTPLHCSCLENPRDGGAWWAAVYGVAQSRTRLKRLSSSSRGGWGVRPGEVTPPRSPHEQRRWALWHWMGI